jgi:hypothetical protein
MSGMIFQAACKSVQKKDRFGRTWPQSCLECQARSSSNCSCLDLPYQRLNEAIQAAVSPLFVLDLVGGLLIRTFPYRTTCSGWSAGPCRPLPTSLSARPSRSRSLPRGNSFRSTTSPTRRRSSWGTPLRRPSLRLFRPDGYGFGLLFLFLCIFYITTFMMITTEYGLYLFVSVRYRTSSCSLPLSFYSSPSSICRSFEFVAVSPFHPFPGILCADP